MRGVGIDIVEVGRIASLARNKRFLSRVYTDGEIKYCGPKKNSAQHFAVRFAAKEAVWKALAARRPRGLSHKDIEIRNASDGSPHVHIRGRRARGLLITLTHTARYAAAFCVCER